jgi:D-arabinose 1-dehydrogenase-like Zn-dependent alcohol dehydrogenase
MDIKKIVVCGAGVMGSGIAQVCANAGYEVWMYDLKEEFAQGGKNKIAAGLDRQVARGKMTQEQKDELLARLHPTVDLNCAADADLIMEEIRKECAVELFGEFQRKFDLVRWGIWYERTLQYNNSYYLPLYIKPYHKYYPVPSDQVAYSDGALNNNDYME